MGEQVFQNRGGGGQVFPFLPSPSPSCTYFVLAPIFTQAKAKNVSNLQKTQPKHFLQYAGYQRIEHKTEQ